MKKTLFKLSAFILAAIMMTSMFTSCAMVLSGSYKSDASFLGQGLNVTYTFKGLKFTATNKITIFGVVTSDEVTGTYEIVKCADGSYEIELDFDEETATFRDGTYTFEDGDGYIKIAGVKYNRVEK